MSFVCARCGASFDGPLPRCSNDGGPLVHRAELRLGEVLAGRYRVTAALGAGATAIVYRGRHDAAGRDVAIKVLRSSLAREPLVRERFLREARAANRVRHENVVDVTDVGEAEDGVPFLVMELLEGQPLRARLGSPWGDARARRLAIELSRALAAGHALGVIHRDLTPENVLLLADGRLKVVDFGVAKLDGERRLTASAAALGTPCYMAPEQVLGEVVSDRTDVYALGCILQEALTGRPPFTGDGPEVMAAQLREPPPPLPEVIEASLRALVVAALAKDPATRPSAADVVTALTGERAPGVTSTAVSDLERVSQRCALVARLVEHLHPRGDVPESVEDGLRRVRHALAARREGGSSAAENAAAEQATIEAALREPVGDGVDPRTMRALARRGRLAERWLLLDELGPRVGSPALTLAEAQAVLVAIEEYIARHPDGVSLLP